MSTPYLGQITAFAFGVVPKGWAACNGQLMPINQQNQALYELLGITYGGDGKTTFALPNLQGCSPIGFGGGYTFGNTGGEASHPLTLSELPKHSHSVVASSSTSLLDPISGNFPAAPSATVATLYGTSPSTTLGNGSSPAGSAAHPNQQPYLPLSFCIATTGIYPSRN
jgi:microcystin-dependent protein